LFVAIFAVFTVKPVCAQTYWPVEIRTLVNNVPDNISVHIKGNHKEYAVTGTYCSDPSHYTKTAGKKFVHVHIDVPTPLVAYKLNPNTNMMEAYATFTLDNHVRWRWDDWFGTEISNRGNVTGVSRDYNEDLTRNCWAYSFGYDIWIRNPAPFYAADGDYEKVLGTPPWPLPGDVIRLSDHVITVTSVNACESPYPVVGTSEKMQGSAIYHFTYDWEKGLGTGYKDYYRPK
jgi:hypothetical protein